MYYRADAGSTVTFVLSVFDTDNPENNPVTSITTAYAVIRRVSDGKYYNWTENTWEEVSSWDNLTSDHKKSLTNNGDGSYSTTWDQKTADSGKEEDYVVIYYIDDATYYYLGHEVWKFSVLKSISSGGSGGTSSYPVPM